MRNQLIFYFGLVLIAGSCTEHKATENERRQTFVLSDTMSKTTQTAVVTLSPLRNELKFYGRITADNNQLIEVYPVVGGNVEKVYAELGDYVKKGDLLATIRSTEVAGFEKELQDAENDVVVARKNLAVAQDIYEGHLAADRDLVEARSQLQKSEAQLNRIRSTYQIYHLKPGNIYEVRSPISGFVIQKNINQDMQLRSDRTDNIFDIARIDEVWAMANVNEGDIENVRLGAEAIVSTLSYPDHPFIGKADKIYNVIDPETKAMKVRVRLSNPNYLLKPDMRATIQLRYEENRSMLTVPASSLIFDKSKTYVMVF